MINKPILYLFTAAVLCGSCDNIIMMVIKTPRKSNASVTIYANEVAFPLSRDADPDKKVIVHVPNDSTGRNKTVYGYGIGFWYDELIERIAGNTDSIVINNTTGRLTISNKEDIKKFLIQHRTGRRYVIKIKAK
jgi:hypothetical protein